MRKTIIHAFFCLLFSCEVLAASSLDALYKKVPDQTVAFAATSGMDAVKGNFDQSILGQIANDPQVEAFFKQIMTSLENIPDFNDVSTEGNTYIAFAKELLRSPTMAGLILDTEDIEKEPTAYIISQTTTDKKALDALFETMIQPQLDSNAITKEQTSGRTVYTPRSDQGAEPFYVARIDDYLMAVLNDPDQALLRRFVRSTSNYKLSRTMAQIPANRDALVGYVDFEKLIPLLDKQALKDNDAKQAVTVLKTLGLYNMQQYLAGMGFEGSQLVSFATLKMSAVEGIWQAFSPVDRTLLNQADINMVQAGVCHIDPSVLYDCIIKAISQVAPAAPDGGDVQSKIAGLEQQIGFKLRDDFFGSLEGTFLGYSLPAYAAPELPMGGYVLTARLKDPAKFQTCMTQIGQLIAALAPGQVQVTSQQSAGGKQINIWAVGVMAMAQIIPSWAIEGNTLVLTSHPKLTGQTLDRIAAGDGDSLMSRPEFAALVKSVPTDAFMIGVADSKAQARQAMMLAQQFWPMARMALIEKGVQLPIMLPSIDAYIEQMKPSVQYGLKTAQGLECHYSGTGLEAGPSSIAATAMGAAILMPALSKTKRIAQRTVSATNLKSIGLASIVYADDHNGDFPQTLDVLVSESDLSPKSLISPRKPDGFDGPDYILIKGLTTAAPAAMVLAYENPAFCDDEVNVLYLDGHVAVDDKESLKQELQKTYEYLKQPMPEIDW